MIGGFVSSHHPSGESACFPSPKDQVIESFPDSAVAQKKPRPNMPCDIIPLKSYQIPAQFSPSFDESSYAMRCIK